MTGARTTNDSRSQANDFELVITDVFNLTGQGVVVIGPITTGEIRTGDSVQIWDGDQLVLGAVATVELICRRPPVPGEIGLRLGNVDINALRPGQTVRATVDAQS